MNLLIVAIVICFICLSRQIQAASGVKPKPMTKKDRDAFYAVILFFVICQIVAFYLGMYADGKLDLDFLF